MDVKLHLKAHSEPHYCFQSGGDVWYPDNPCWMYTLLKRLDDAEFALRNVGMDYGEKCDHPKDCNCSMAKAVRHWAKYDNLSMDEVEEIFTERGE